MPDEPRPAEGAGEHDKDLDQELAEFEAELFRAAEGHGLELGKIEGRGSGDEEGGEESRASDLPSEEEIEARLSRAIKDAEAYLGPIRGSSLDPQQLAELEALEKELPEEELSRFHEQHPDLEGRLKELEARAAAANRSRREAAQNRRRVGGAEGDSARGLGIGLTVAYSIIGGPLAGALIGWMIDSRMKTDTWTGVCVVIGAVAGIAMGLLILNRTQSEK